MQKEKCGMENHEWKSRNGKTGSGKTMLTVLQRLYLRVMKSFSGHLVLRVVGTNLMTFLST